MKKVHIDQRVAALLGMRVSEVQEVTGTFFRILLEMLVQEGRIAIDGFGIFRFYQQTGKTPRVEQLRSIRGETLLVDTRRKFRVSFQKAPAFKALIWERFGKAPTEKPMEKYAVDEQVDQEKLEKKASDGCPKCGSKLEKHGRVLVCPRCGSEPFEK